MKRLSEEEIEEIGWLIDDIGLDEFIADGEAEDSFRHTHIEPVLMKYIEVREKLVLALREMGFDV